MQKNVKQKGEFTLLSIFHTQLNKKRVKTIDKSQKMWYHIIKEREREQRPKEILQKEISNGIRSCISFRNAF